MAWTITADHIAEKGEKTRVGWTGNGFTVDTDLAECFRVGPNTTDAQKFRLLDDDGNLYYEGWLIDEDWEGALDFGIADAGCTTITDGRGKHVIS